MSTTHRPYRVLMVIPFVRHIGGMERQSLQLAQALSRRGVGVTFLTTARLWEFFGSKPARVHGDIEGFPVVTIPGVYIPIMKNFPLEFLLWGMAYLAFHRRSFDILHGHQLFSSGVVVGAGTRLFGIPSLVKLARSGKLGDVEDVETRPFQRIKKFIFRSITRFIAMTPAFVEDLTHFGIAQEKIALIPNGVDTERFAPPASREHKNEIRTRLGLPLDRPIVLMDSRLSPSKRPEHALAAWKIVHDAEPNALLVVIGRGGSRESLPPHLTMFVHKHGLEACVDFRGVVPNPEDYAKAADLFTLGSRSEGISNALLQAATTELGIAVPNNPGNASVIQDGVSGILADLDSPESLARALLFLLQNPEQTKTMGERAREHVQKHFSFSSVSSEYLNLYHELTRANVSASS
ncbi:MAG: glycosyltransferase family 4 protein [Candidatus Kerfeldbacteria bacterium]|nr:glycosyltransferase family 4 protein [Candidatus Kerfeldbacteria bacterium]